PLDYRIALDFQALEVVADEDLVLRANWVIRARDAQRGPWIGQFGVRNAVAGRGAEDFVAAHNEALGLLARQIATRIEALEVEARADTTEQPARD
ncbi:MAG TPA: ABC-type transport auxiliary lipoprotein family protein, partial [Myxococcota bacterium]|nr:ABC-type transport auxiliary lipoprotein family protein [Myxococcota bacterium]